MTSLIKFLRFCDKDGSKSLILADVLNLPPIIQTTLLSCFINNLRGRSLITLRRTVTFLNLLLLQITNQIFFYFSLSQNSRPPTKKRTY